MISLKRISLLFSILILSCNQMEQPQIHNTPIVIAHRGAQFLYPEHTMEGYKKAIELGADFIEPDLVMTKDGVLVARHEPFISGTTNVSVLPEYADRKTTKMLDGVPVTDWFVSDFTLSELKTLRARQSWEERTHEYDDLFEIPTFEEIIAFAKANKTTSGNPVGIYPELKHPSYHRELGLVMEDLFLNQITKAGYVDKSSPIFVQCFEVSTLQYISARSDVRLIQLIGAAGISSNGDLRFSKEDGSYDPEGQPYDFILSKDARTYNYFTTKEGMKFVSTYADGIGPWKPFVISYSKTDEGEVEMLASTDFVALAHEQKLEVHPYTFRKEDTLWSENNEGITEYQLFFEAGVDGVFSDYTKDAVAARNKFLATND
ncbi:glycerophosphodiester phosphodiesterase [Dokdonia sp. Dokd-P16]|nr:glycerophosphodiester phosphodiesterase [Dokdonia sp. Dokd-P16]